MSVERRVMVSSVCTLVLNLILPSFFMSTSDIERENEFEINVKDFLSVSVTTSSAESVGNINTFLRNKVSFRVTTNDENGFVASMHTKTQTTDLVHIANKGTIPTLASSAVRSSFPVNRWGYSLNDTDAGNNSSTYSALVGAGGTPITLISSAQSQTIKGRDVFFGTKADISAPSGKYVSTVVLDVVTGVIDPDDNPITPVNPAQPSSTYDTPIYSGVGTTTGGTTNGATIYTYKRSNTVATEVSDGDNRSQYSGYTPPQGVTEIKRTSSEVSEGPSLAAVLATTSVVAAATGVAFFVASKRRKEDEEKDQ